jgi:hypothetical protein
MGKIPSADPAIEEDADIIEAVVENEVKDHQGEAELDLEALAIKNDGAVEDVVETVVNSDDIVEDLPNKDQIASLEKNPGTFYITWKEEQTEFGFKYNIQIEVTQVEGKPLRKMVLVPHESMKDICQTVRCFVPVDKFQSEFGTAILGGYFLGGHKIITDGNLKEIRQVLRDKASNDLGILGKMIQLETSGFGFLQAELRKIHNSTPFAEQPFMACTTHGNILRLEQGKAPVMSLQPKRDFITGRMHQEAVPVCPFCAELHLANVLVPKSDRANLPGQPRKSLLDLAAALEVELQKIDVLMPAGWDTNMEILKDLEASNVMGALAGDEPEIDRTMLALVLQFALKNRKKEGEHQ